MKFGTDYYPEHWPEDRWPEDAKLMNEAGIRVVRMAEFAWAKFEPQLGVFDFEWLDKAIEVMGQYDIKVVLGTPTPTPPIWLVEQHPEILPVDINGVTRGFGGRHHDCQSNEIYREHIRRFVRIMAEHYSRNPHVIGWQTDNEFGNSHQNLCTCDSCRSAFHKWLQKKYQTIDKLNDAWGTVFWSQTYSRFDQIPAPLPTPNSHNPGLLLDWKRFTSDLIVEFQKIQIDILREECPHHFVTHNYMGFFDKTNYFDLSRDLDFISHDQYPIHYRQGRDMTAVPHKLGAALDLMRGIKQQTFWIMEQQSGPTGWELIGATPRPGQLRLWTWQSIAHGADTVVYFRWRTCLFGTEEYWHGILPHNGKPGRRYDEIQKAIGELSPVMDSFKGCLAGAEVAILFSYDQEWALQIQPHHPDLDYVKYVQGIYKGFYDANIPVDMIAEDIDFNRYKVLVAPLLYLMTPLLADKLEQYVANGGHLVLTMRTAVKDWNNRVVPHTLPGEKLAPVVGIQIEDYDCLREIKQNVRWMVQEGAGDSEPAHLWCDIITLNGAKALAVYNNDFYQDTPAITQNSYKNGIAYYVGTELSPNTMGRLVQHLVQQAGVYPILTTPEGVEVTRRRGNEADYIFIMNHTNIPVEVEIPKEWNTLLGSEYRNEVKLSLPPYEVALIKADRKND